MTMETPNLMDVPTQATRRIERYGLLALVLFLTTFGVLYAWDSPSSSEESSDTVMAGGRAVSGVQPRSTARPSRLPSADSARESRQANLPRANVDHEQRQLAERQRARREAARVEAERAAARGRRRPTHRRQEPWCLQTPAAPYLLWRGVARGGGGDSAGHRARPGSCPCGSRPARADGEARSAARWAGGPRRAAPQPGRSENELKVSSKCSTC